MIRKFSILMLVCLFALIFTGCGNDKYVEQVRSGTMDMAPNVEVGRAFDNFFSNGKWKSFMSKQNERIVEFNGECTWNDRSAALMVQFKVDKTASFEMGAMEINGVGLNNMEALLTLQKILMGER